MRESRIVIVSRLLASAAFALAAADAVGGGRAGSASLPNGRVADAVGGGLGEIDGIYPHLAMSNDEGECGTGAVVPWAGSLWAVTYGPHCPTGSSDKLYQITPDLRQIVRAESVGGTHANRMIHRETNQLLIGPYVIDARGNVRVVPPERMPGRLTGAARHLTDPADKAYVATMETGLYELDMRTLEVKTIIRENGKNDRAISNLLARTGAPWPAGWDAAPRTHVPGYHAKGLASGFGRVYVANNGEDTEEARRNPFVPSGVLADWSKPGEDWRTIRRCQFTEVTTRDGIYGNEHPDTNPVWSLGWDAKSVILAVTTNGTEWTHYRLPKASHCYDGAHGWNTEWPRIREAGLGDDALLATMHGTFWRFPKGFSPAKPNGIRPISTYLKVIGDFAYWKDAPGGGAIVFGCDDHAKNEFLGKRSLKSDQPKIARSTSNLWFVKPENLASFGPPTGEGWVWLNEDVKAGALSEPYLWAGYAERTFTFVDADGRAVRHELVYEGDWVRVKPLEDAKGVKAHFVYAPPEPVTLPKLDAEKPLISYTDERGDTYRFPNVNGDTRIICREVATERDLLYVGGVFYELPAENAGGFSALRPIVLADEPVRTIAVTNGLVVINGKPMALDSLWRNGTAPAAYALWRRAKRPDRTVIVEAERFKSFGGWKLDSQFRSEMGSSYLIAHGLGKPVEDAVTTFTIPESGSYLVSVSTKNWTAPWSSATGAGRFRVAVDGRELETDLGGQGDGRWTWVPAADRAITLSAGTHTLALRDLTGFDGRVDAVAFAPPGWPIRRVRASAERVIEPDLTVVGGGVAGVCAAISAARLGLKVALVQDRPVLGGANSSEVRVHLGGRQNLGPYPRLGDVVAEIGPAHGGNARDAANYEDDRKLAAVRAEKNITLFLNTRVERVVTGGGQAIEAVVGYDVANENAVRFVSPLYADCTGDGTVGWLAGADWRLGREGRGETGESRAPEKGDAMTMGASVQWYAATNGPACGFPAEPWMIAFDERNCEYNLRGDWDWETGMNRDQLNDFESVRDYGLLVVYSNWSFIKNFGARKGEFATAALDWAAYVAGKRETRRLMGDYVLAEQDIVDDVPHEDGTCLTTWSIDLHCPMDENVRNYPGEPFRSVAVHTVHCGHPIPYRCLYSRNVPNLFMAGRDISVTHVALGTTRVMRTCGMTGEVVGMAAAVCRRHGCNPRGVYESHLGELKGLMTKGVGRGVPQPPQDYNQGAMKSR